MIGARFAFSLGESVSTIRLGAASNSTFFREKHHVTRCIRTATVCRCRLLVDLSLMGGGLGGAILIFFVAKLLGQ
jgi:hypothetical protein